MAKQANDTDYKVRYLDVDIAFSGWWKHLIMHRLIQNIVVSGIKHWRNICSFFYVYTCSRSVYNSIAKFMFMIQRSTFSHVCMLIIMYLILPNYWLYVFLHTFLFHAVFVLGLWAMYAHCLNKRMLCSDYDYKQGTRHNSDKSAIFDKTLLKKVVNKHNKILK